MSSKPPIKFTFPAERPRMASGDAAERHAPQKAAEGVPLAKLIKRDLEALPEIVMLSDPRSLFAERFRRLKTTLVNLAGQSPRAIVVSSGAPSEGKTTISINLALAFAADTDERTLLVDADLRRPTLDHLVRPKTTIGLSHLLSGSVTDDHAILSINQSRLHLLPAGEPVRDPLELLGSARLRQVIDSLRERYDRIIIDTPPLVPFSDADAIGKLSDGILMVVRANATTVSTYRRALESVTSTRVLGVVLNDAAKTSLADWGDYQGRYGDKYYHAYYSGISGEKPKR